MARDAKADLFVSIHADTLADATDVSGATVYTASDRASDAEAARVADDGKPIRRRGGRRRNRRRQGRDRTFCSI